MRILVNILLGILCITAFGVAQTISNQNDPISGTWKGTSLCQVKNSSCNDEVVVCYITKAQTPNIYRFAMNKIVNNAEITMGDLDFIYNEAQHTLTCHSASSGGDWKFDITKNVMEGTLTVNNKTLFRIIKLVKS